MEEGEEEEEEEEKEEAWPSDSEIETALEWLDLKDAGEAGDGAFAPNSRRPNAHGRASHACPVVHAPTPVRSEPKTLHSYPHFPFWRRGSEG